MTIKFFLILSYLATINIIIRVRELQPIFIAYVNKVVKSVKQSSAYSV